MVSIPRKHEDPVSLVTNLVAEFFARNGMKKSTGPGVEYVAEPILFPLYKDLSSVIDRADFRLVPGTGTVTVHYQFHFRLWTTYCMLCPFFLFFILVVLLLFFSRFLSPYFVWTFFLVLPSLIFLYSGSFCRSQLAAYIKRRLTPVLHLNSPRP